MYRLEQMATSRWWRWVIRLIGTALALGAAVHGAKGLYHWLL